MFVVPWLWNNKRKKINEKMARILNNTNISVVFFFFLVALGFLLLCMGYSGCSVWPSHCGDLLRSTGSRNVDGL